MIQNFPFPLQGESAGNISDSIAIGTGVLWYMPTTDEMKDDETLAIAYGLDGPHEDAVCLGLLKENVTFNYEMIISKIVSGTPQTIKKRKINSVEASLTATLAELDINSLSLFMPDLSNFIVDNHFNGELPIYSFSFVNAKPHTGGGIVIHFPYATISGKVTLNFQETSITVANLELVAMGDTVPRLVIS